MSVGPSNKRRAVISYDNMSQELRDAFNEKYPRGYADYLGDIFKVDKPDGTFFHAVTVEIPDAIYLVKINVNTDDIDSVEKDLFNDNGDDDEGGEGDNDVLPGNDSDFNTQQDDDNEED